MKSKMAAAASKRKTKAVAESEVSEQESDGAFFNEIDEEEMEWSDAATGSEIDEEDLEDEDEEDFEDEEDMSEEDEEEEVDSEELSEEDSEMVDSEEVSDEEMMEEDDEDDEAIEDSDDELNEDDLNVEAKSHQTNNPLLQYFWKLSDEDKSVRIAATMDLLTFLVKSQGEAQFDDVVEGGEEKIFSLYDGGKLANTCCSDVTYAIKRLLKGLASGRGYTRLGFMLALMGVYQTFVSILDAEVLLTWSVKLSSSEALGGSLKSREEKELIFARLFALSAMIRTDVYQKLSADSKLLIVDELMTLSKKKSFVKESCLEALMSVLAKEAKNQTFIDQFLVRLDEMTLSAEVLALLLFLQTTCSVSLADKKLKVLENFAQTDKIVTKKNSSVLYDILKESISTTGKHLHAVWKLVLDGVDFGGKNASSVQLADFVRELVDASLLNSSGVQKRQTGFLLIKEIYGRLTEAGQSVAVIFSPAVVKLIRGSIGALNKKTSKMAGKEVASLNKAVSQFFRNVLEEAKDNSVVAVDVLMTLSKYQGLLEELSGEENFTQELQGKLSCDGVITMIKSIETEINGQLEKTERSVIAFQAPFDKLIKLVQSGEVTKVAGSDKAIEAVVTIFAKFSLTEEVTLSSEEREVVKARFSSLLNELADSKKFAQANWIQVVGTILAKAANKKKSKDLKIEADEPTMDALKNLEKIRDLLQKQKSDSDDRKKLLGAVSMIADFLSVLVFLDPTESIPMVEELFECLTAVSKSQKRKDFDKAVSVVVDMLMSFLSRPSQFARRIADLVFKSIISLMNLDSLNILIQILKSKDSSGDLFEEENDEMEGEDEDNFEDEEEMEEEGSNAFDSMTPETERDDEDESDLDDDQMGAYDAKLVEIFKEKKKQQLGKKQAKKIVAHFKFKVMDVLTMIFKSPELPNRLRVEAIEPFLEVLKMNIAASSAKAQLDQKQFAAKFEAFFTESYAKSVKASKDEDAKFAEQTALSLMENVLANKTFDNAAILSRVSQSVWFLIKFCRSTANFSDKQISAKFSALMKSSLSPEERKFKILKSFFFNWINWDMKFALEIVKNASELKGLLISPAMKPFQRAQLFEFLMNLLKKCKSEEEKKQAVLLLNTVCEALSAAFLPSLSATIKAFKVEALREEIKFIGFASKKHMELDAEETMWDALLTTGLDNIEEHLKTGSTNLSNSTKSLLGQIKSMKPSNN